MEKTRGVQRNSAYEEILVGQTVDRLDHYKVGGEVKVINPAHGVRCILVRWPMLEDEWCSPELLVPRETLAEGGAQ